MLGVLVRFVVILYILKEKNYSLTFDKIVLLSSLIRNKIILSFTKLKIFYHLNVKTILFSIFKVSKTRDHHGDANFARLESK